MQKYIKSVLLSIILCVLVVFNAHATQINVLTLNVWMIPVQGKKAKQRSRLIGQKTSSYDLVFLQEAFRKNLRKVIKSNANPSFEDVYEYQRGNVLGSGLYNFSRFKVVKTDFKPFGSCRSIQCGASKGVLFMRIRLPNGVEIDTFNTHLQAYQKDSGIRLKQLDDAKKFLDKHLSDRPAIFAGDFNVIASTDEYKVLKSYLIGYTDVWLDYSPSEDGFTWDPYINQLAKIDEDESVQKQRIDYIFVKDGKDKKWNILDAKVEFQESYQVLSQSIFLSDHFGVSSLLELK